jgi:4-amino-4-deoxy-L-arabinose transferase-like glycosyltransferase
VELAARGGLFNNGYFTSVFDVIFPWSYDAVHLPFLALGWGYALPGFACLAGTCFIALRLVRARFGAEAAWVAVASLLALPCLVYQGASTKNDIPILFSGAVWLYARWRWHREGKNIHLVWMVLAIGFMAGAKTTGLIYGFILALAMLGEIRRQPRLALQVAAGLAGALLLWGSGETYVESARIYGHPLGPPALVRRLSNQDGLRGGVANLIRHAAGGIYVGPTDFRDGQVAAFTVAAATKDLLDKLGLTGAGAEPRFGDRRQLFSQSGMEELSGFGAVGMLALATILFAGIRWRPRALWWQLAAAAAVGFALVSFTAAFNPWQNRYLISWYALGTLALVCALWQRETPGIRTVRRVFLAIVLGSVVAAPLQSFNRRPADLVAAVADRERLETDALPLLGRTRERLRSLRAQAPGAHVYFVVSDESVVLPILEDAALDALLVTPTQFHQLAAEGRLAAGDLVIQEYDTDQPFLVRVEQVSAPNMFSDHRVLTRWIYRVR